MIHESRMRIHLDDFKGGVYPKGELEVYRVKNEDGYLNGWFRVRVRFEADADKADMQKALIGMVLFVRDDHFRRQNIGEFVHNFPTKTQYPDVPGAAGNSCPTNDATKYMIISCGGASAAEPLVSNMIVLMRDNPKDGGGNSIWPTGVDSSKIIPNLEGRNELNFYIRIPIQDCNQKKALVFKAKLLIDKDYTRQISHSPRNLVRQLTTVLYLNPSSVPGIADPLPPPQGANKLRCDDRIQEHYPWYTTSDGEKFQTGNIPKNHGCQGYYFVGRCKHSWYDLYFSLYAGSVSSDARLRHVVNQNEAQTDFAPHCEAWRVNRSISQSEAFSAPYYVKPKLFYTDQKHEIPFRKTSQYLKDTEVKCNSSGYNGNPLCNITKNDNATLLSRMLIISGGQNSRLSRSLSLFGFNSFISGYSRSNDSKENMYLGVRFELGGYTRLVWGLRRGHATIMAIITLFIIPVSLFMTRYYKESFMTRRVLLTRIWYQVHIHGTFLAATLLAAALGISYIASTYLGESRTVAAVIHRVVGAITVFLFVMLFALGGFRGYADPLRKSTIWLHWVFGTLSYLLMRNKLANIAIEHDCV
ncbi:unnamed protein product [Orchesella dallaii]|uniref:ascorbate ferrireductase (transmembrane) n=1 Tax=Orchesella dallaii TaxID=48710 RepID=A0ABP1REY9_9HEXA